MNQNDSRKVANQLIQQLQMSWCDLYNTIRCGREDLDILGLTFRKDLFCSTRQIYSPIDDQKKSLTHPKPPTNPLLSRQFDH
ncbi:unnamed protein product [Adineta ricciae]|uniref:Uncharacterized protein n=1 Tax=Adineta ricciae TaxID=249248 RepID=A0A814H9G3_ADIRI|nr:unnamed protein product [Adineta ricciae]